MTRDRPGDLDELAAARTLLRNHLVGIGLTTDGADGPLDEAGERILLAAEEMTSNGVRHGHPPVRMSLARTRTSTTCLLLVTDRSPGRLVADCRLETRVGTAAPDLDRQGGSRTAAPPHRVNTAQTSVSELYGMPSSPVCISLLASERATPVGPRAPLPLSCAGAVALAAFSWVDPATPTLAERWATWAVAAASAVLATWCWRGDAHRSDRWGLLTAAPALGAVLVCAQGWHTSDVSASVQVFLAVPVVAAATQLRAAGAAVTVGVAVLGDLVTTLHLLPVLAALTDVFFVGTTLAVIATVLVRLEDSQAADKDALARVAAVDTLTGLVTRRVLDDALATALSSAASAQGTALILVDVDEFKAINDVYGHPMGDDALRHLARVLAGCVRERDAVVSRMGGDELAVLLPGCSAEVALARAGDLVSAVRAAPLRLPDGTVLPVTVSVGVAQVPRHAEGLRELYAAADAALYEAKRGGRNRCADAAA